MQNILCLLLYISCSPLSANVPLILPQVYAETITVGTSTSEIVQDSKENYKTTQYSTSSIKSLIEAKSAEYGVSKDLVIYIVEHESGYDQYSLGDMTITCKKRDSPNYGKPVRARGILQFTDCYYPEVSDSEAFDPLWSLDKALPMIADKKTCLAQWTTCRDYYKL